jgi:hypothetical protein
MPEPTSGVRGTMLNADMGSPVPGGTEAEAIGVAVALAEGLGEALADINGDKGPPAVLAIGLSDGETDGETETPGITWGCNRLARPYPSDEGIGDEQQQPGKHRCGNAEERDSDGEQEHHRDRQPL